MTHDNKKSLISWMVPIFVQIYQSSTRF